MSRMTATAAERRGRGPAGRGNRRQVSSSLRMPHGRGADRTHRPEVLMSEARALDELLDDRPRRFDGGLARVGVLGVAE